MSEQGEDEPVMRPSAGPSVDELLSRKRRRSRSEKPSAKWGGDGSDRRLVAVMVIGGMVLVLMMGFGILWWVKSESGAAEIGTTQRARVVDEEMDSASAEDWKGALPEEAVEGFTTATTVEERMRWVRDTEWVEPTLREFFTNGPGATETVAAVNAMGRAQTSSLTFLRYQVVLGDGGRRLLCVVVDEENGAKVDFECYARHGTATWDVVLEGTVREAIQTRIFVERGSYYNFKYANEKRWQHFVASSPDLEDVVNLYAARGSDECRQLESITAGGMMRATVAMRAVGDSFRKRQFEVLTVLAAGWVVDRGKPWTLPQIGTAEPPLGK